MIAFGLLLIVRSSTPSGDCGGVDLVRRCTGVWSGTLGVRQTHFRGPDQVMNMLETVGKSQTVLHFMVRDLVRKPEKDTPR